MKFWQSILWLTGASAVLLYASVVLIGSVLLQLFFALAGLIVLALEGFAIAVWAVNWKYYPE